MNQNGKWGKRGGGEGSRGSDQVKGKKRNKRNRPEIRKKFELGFPFCDYGLQRGGGKLKKLNALVKRLCNETRKNLYVRKNSTRQGGNLSGGGGGWGGSRSNG